ncbi:MAG TPA: SdiA-regulated domain-containing protein [Ignavibacteria bacterium]
MTRPIIIIFIIILFACGSKKDETKKDESKKEDKKTEKNPTVRSEKSNLSWYDIENEEISPINLSDELNEISGITFTNDDRLFAHEDEDADIFQLNPENGEIIKRFSLGDLLVLKGDFEDIAFVNDRFYLAESKGNIYEFKEGDNGSFVTYKKYKTSLNSSNNVEGLCFDNATNSLLLACKDSPGEGYEKQKAIYSFSLSSMTLDEKPRFLIDLKSIKKNTIENEFGPSGISKHPFSGSFFVVAARGNTIVEIDKDGAVINQKDLPEKLHKQAEGIAFKKDGTLFISDEGKNKGPMLFVYKMNK